MLGSFAKESPLIVFPRLHENAKTMETREHPIQISIQAQIIVKETRKNNTATIDIETVGKKPLRQEEILWN